MAIPTLYVEITIPRFSGFWPNLVPATLGPDPNFDPWVGFPKVAKRFWPLRPPIGLRFETFAIARRGLTDSGDGFGLKRPMARNSNPVFFRIFGPPSLGPYYSPIDPLKGHGCLGSCAAVILHGSRLICCHRYHMNCSCQAKSR